MKKTSSTTVVRRYIAYQDKEITINLVDAWGIQQDKWNDKYFEEYLDGILDGVDKDRIEIDRPDTKNPMCSLDLVLFFLPSFTCKPIPQNESLNHSYFPYIDVCKRKRVPYAFLVSFVGMENEERKKKRFLEIIKMLLKKITMKSNPKLQKEKEQISHRTLPTLKSKNIFNKFSNQWSFQFIRSSI